MSLKPDPKPICIALVVHLRLSVAIALSGEVMQGHFLNKTQTLSASERETRRLVLVDQLPARTTSCIYLIHDGKTHQDGRTAVSLGT